MHRFKLLLSALFLSVVDGQVVISEIADKGTSDVCNANDWLELFNAGSEAVDLAGFILHDDNGPLDASAYTFPANSILPANEYLLLCAAGEDADGPLFRIGGDDTISLVNTANEVVDSVGPLPDTDSAFDVTYALNVSDGMYLYTTTPTPGTSNILTPIVVETPEQIKERLANQNQLGTRFFGMDGQGFPVADRLDDVLDLYITMEQADYDYLLANQSYEVYSPFTSARLSTKDNEGILNITSPGRIRPKGQSTLYFGTCFGSPTIPFQLDFNNVNETQTLFGVERLYLRNHLSDNSYMRDWASHRMLARFGLPHLRARKVRFFINGERQGFYTLLEAPDQDYVFARSFPTFDPASYALYKVQTLSIGCGAYTDTQLETARARINDTTTPPYAFERGEHRPITPVLGFERGEECIKGFINNILGSETADVVLAYVRSNEECGKMLVEQGIIDRDLGDNEFDPKMETFIDDHLADNICDPGCANSNLASQVDTENFLKNFAVYAVTLNGDSPMGNGNNYYLADSGDGTGWKIVQYDHNNIGGDLLCDPPRCDEHLIYWSITRPTCATLESNQIVGPLLTDPVLHAQYIEYVRSFVDTVLGNASFVEEMTQHAEAIQEDVTQDFWSSGGIYFDAELSPDAAEWNASTSSIEAQYPFLPLLKARAEAVQDQLKAIDDGTFPRGPHLEQEVEPWEKCVDWRATEPPPTACYQNCQYEGCAIFGWLLPGFCDETTGTCLHGNIDEQCEGIADGSRYDGMENREDGRATFCINFAGFPAEVSQCPEPIASDGDSSDGDSETDVLTSGSAYQSFQKLLLALSLAICVAFAL